MGSGAFWGHGAREVAPAATFWILEGKLVDGTRLLQQDSGTGTPRFADGALVGVRTIVVP